MTPPAFSAGDLLGLVADRLPPDLVTPAALDRVRERARRLPAFPTGGIECRLAPGADGVDFGLLASEHSGGRTLLAECDDVRLRDLGAAWRDEASPLFSSLRTVGLEFDLASGGGARGPDGVFVTFRHHAGPAPVDLAFEAARHLGLKNPNVEVIVRECAARLPDDVLLQTFGFMLGRSPAFVRLNLGGRVGSRLKPCLEGLGWAGAWADVERVLPSLRPCVDFFVACLDVSDRLSPRLGLECFARHRTRLIDALVALGLCSVEKAAALGSWDRTWTSFRDPSLEARVPAPLVWVDVHRPGGVRTLVNHLKVDFRPGHTPEAKAYLSYACVWPSPASTSR